MTTTSLYEDPSEYPLNTPDWYSDAIKLLRGSRDKGIFGLYLYHIIKFNPDIDTIINIGTARGHSAVCAAKGLEAADREGIVHTIDIIPPDEARDWSPPNKSENDAVIGKGKTIRQFIDGFHPSDDDSVPIQFHTGDSSEILSNLATSPDLVFHDGLHRYAKVSRDVDATMAMSSSPPIQVFDDCYLYQNRWTHNPFLSEFWSPVETVPTLGGILHRARMYFLGKKSYRGVTKAVKEAKDTYDWDRIEIVGYGSENSVTALLPSWANGCE